MSSKDGDDTETLLQECHVKGMYRIYKKGDERERESSQRRVTLPRTKPRFHASSAVTSHWLLAHPSRNQPDRLSRSLACLSTSSRGGGEGGEKLTAGLQSNTSTCQFSLGAEKQVANDQDKELAKPRGGRTQE